MLTGAKLKYEARGQVQLGACDDDITNLGAPLEFSLVNHKSSLASGKFGHWKAEAATEK